MGLIIDRKKNKLPRLDSINFQLLNEKNLLILNHILQSPCIVLYKLHCFEPF